MAVSKKLMPRSRACLKNGWLSASLRAQGWLPGRRGPGGGDAIGHAAETDAGDFEAGLAEIDVVHAFSMFGEGVPPLYPGCKLFIFNILAKVVPRKIVITNGLRPKSCK